MRRLRIIALSAIALLFLLAAAELACRKWLWSAPHPQPLAYADSPYWGSQFLSEVDQMSAARVWDAKHEVWLGDYQGRFVSLKNGLRGTSDQPDKYQQTIYLFGSSTVFDGQVPDNFTKASYLQRLFNQSGFRARVLNMGDSGILVWDNLRQLKRIKLAPGDIVIFYTGSHEYAHYGLALRRKMAIAGQLCSWLESTFRGRWALFKAYCRLSDEYLLPPDKPSQREIDQATERYRQAIVEAYQYATESGAKFYDFLPPFIYSMPLSDKELPAVSDPDIVPPGDEVSYDTAWPSMQAAVQQLNAQGITSVDLTHVLDQDRRAGHILYIDHAHTNERGNSIIATAIFNVIVPF